MVPRLHLQVLSINQDTIVNVALSSFFNMQGALSVVDSFEDVMDMGVYYSNSIKLCLCSW